MANATLDVIINSRGATQGASEAGRAADSIKSSFIDIAAKAFVAERALAQIWAQATAGARFEETMSRLNRQMGAFHSTNQVLITDLQAISQNTLGIDKAATIASRALSVGLDPSQIVTFTQAAMLLKNVMGTELPQAFDEIVQAAITGRGAVLGNIGVYLDLDKQVRQLAVSTNRTTEQITKQEKVMLTAKSITAQIGEATRRLSDGMLSDADRLKQVEARFDNFLTKLAEGANVAVQKTMLSLDTIVTYIEKHPGLFIPGFGALKALPSSEMFGPPSPGNLGIGPPTVEPPKPPPTALRGGILEAEFARQDAIRQGDLDRTKAFLDATARLYDTDVQLQIRTAEEVVTQKGDLLLQELAKTGETLSLQLAKENEFSALRKKIGFDSTEERISEETRHKDKVVEIEEKLRATVLAFGLQSDQNVKDRAIARNTAETALGQRQTEMVISKFQISEAERQKDFDATQTYYQGLADMGVAQFASDSEIARKERELLREQLAFKLRITTEEADRVLFLRKAGHAADAAEIAGRGDPTLEAKAVEGMIESATSKDILAAERANDDFFAGWRRGLQKYSSDRDSAFGLSADMARRTAQAMEQGFQTFFFDLFEGRIKSLKDVLTSVLDFTKRIISQMVAQMVTARIIGAIGSIGSSWTLATHGPVGHAALGGEVVQNYAFGGPVPGSGMRDTVPALLTPGEFVLSRADVSDIKRGVTGGNPIINITINENGSRTQASPGATPNFNQLARDLSKLVESKLIEEQRPGGLLAGGTA